MSNISVLIIYHSEDLDGICSRDVVKRWAKTNNYDTTCLGWTHGQPMPEIPEHYTYVVIADIMLDIPTMTALHERHSLDKQRVIWIDHHYTSIELAKANQLTRFAGIQEVGKGACELCWSYFFSPDNVPLVVQLLSAYDVWDKQRFNWRLDTLPFQYGMRTFDHISEVLLDPEYCIGLSTSQEINEICNRGIKILQYLSSKYKKDVEISAFEAEVCGYDTLCINSQDAGSQIFESVKDSKYSLFLVFRYSGLNYKFSIYAAGGYDVDCGQIAKSFGGGGHKGAAGWEFTPSETSEFLRTRHLTAPIEDENPLQVIQEFDNGDRPGEHRSYITLILNQVVGEDELIVPSTGEPYLLRRSDQFCTVLCGRGFQQVFVLDDCQQGHCPKHLLTTGRTFKMVTT